MKTFLHFTALTLVLFATIGAPRLVSAVSDGGSCTDSGAVKGYCTTLSACGVTNALEKASCEGALTCCNCPVGNSCQTSAGAFGQCSTANVCVASAGGNGCTPAGAPCRINGEPGHCTGSDVCQADTVTGGNNNNNNNGSQGPTVGLVDPLGGMTLQTFLTSILDFVIQIGTVVIIFMIVYIGYLFVVARGDPTKLTEARRALLWTVVGALILLGSKAIALGIQQTVDAIQQGAR